MLNLLSVNGIAWRIYAQVVNSCAGGILTAAALLAATTATSASATSLYYRTYGSAVGTTSSAAESAGVVQLYSYNSGPYFATLR
jgi:hypothetical protein